MKEAPLLPLYVDTENAPPTYEYDAERDSHLAPRTRMDPAEHERPFQGPALPEDKSRR